MGILQTAERSSATDSSENVVFQRHLVAYKETAKLISGTVLEIGSGEGYGIRELVDKCDKYIAIDKYATKINSQIQESKNIKFIECEVPPLKNIDDNCIDFVVSFQVIEHIHEDKYFLSEIKRVLKKNGKLILTTPNKKMSLSRNPWHIREYTVGEMTDLLADFFPNTKVMGVFGNEKVMSYYKKNKEAIQKITRFDIFNLQYKLPRWILQIPYDILNRFNRHALEDDNSQLVKSVTTKDYYIDTTNEECLDHFCISTKN
tara:strand:+ start:10493 stop:11272 length:780 start_codon:yes stop_codon:yes gene_type:complete